MLALGLGEGMGRPQLGSTCPVLLLVFAHCSFRPRPRRHRVSKPGSPVLLDAYSPQAAPAVLITDDTTHHTLGARDLCPSLSPVGAAAWGRGLYLPGAKGFRISGAA